MERVQSKTSTEKSRIENQRQWDAINTKRIVEKELRFGLPIKNRESLRLKQTTWLNVIPSPNVGTFLN